LVVARLRDYNFGSNDACPGTEGYLAAFGGTVLHLALGWVGALGVEREMM